MLRTLTWRLVFARGTGSIANGWWTGVLHTVIVDIVVEFADIGDVVL